MHADAYTSCGPVIVRSGDTAFAGGAPPVPLHLPHTLPGHRAHRPADLQGVQRALHGVPHGAAELRWVCSLHKCDWRVMHTSMQRRACAYEQLTPCNSSAAVSRRHSSALQTSEGDGAAIGIHGAIAGYHWLEVLGSDVVNAVAAEVRL